MGVLDDGVGIRSMRIVPNPNQRLSRLGGDPVDVRVRFDPVYRWLQSNLDQRIAEALDLVDAPADFPLKAFCGNRWQQDPLILASMT